MMSITEEEMSTLLLRAIAAKGEAGCAEVDLVKIVEWAEDARTDNLLLEMVLAGDLNIEWSDDEGEPMFSAATVVDKTG